MKIGDKEIIIPGEMVLEEVHHGNGLFVEDRRTFSSVIGLLKKGTDYMGYVPLAGGYVPHVGDIVVGLVTRVYDGGCEISISAAYSGILPAAEIVRRRDDHPRSHYKIGDRVMLKISRTNELHEPIFTGPRKITGGQIIKIPPNKVPRVIGKKRSMLSVIRDKGNCMIIAGQNGYIWINGKKTDMDLVIKAIELIVNKAHTSGLTDRISTLFDEWKKNEKQRNTID